MCFSSHSPTLPVINLPGSPKRNMHHRTDKNVSVAQRASELSSEVFGRYVRRTVYDPVNEEPTQGWLAVLCSICSVAQSDRTVTKEEQSEARRWAAAVQAALQRMQHDSDQGHFHLWATRTLLYLRDNACIGPLETMVSHPRPPTGDALECPRFLSRSNSVTTQPQLLLQPSRP